MSKLKFLLLTLVVIAVSGCALGVRYQTATASWVGAPIEDVLSAWGYPDITEPRPDGERLYKWVEYIWDGYDPSQVAAAMANDPTAAYSSFGTDYACLREITTDVYGKVKTAWNSYDCWRSDNIPETRPAGPETGVVK